MPRVSFQPTGLTLLVPAGTTLLEAARRADLPIAQACSAAGLCSRCALHVIGSTAGLSAENNHEVAVKRRNRLDTEVRLACQARVAGDVEVTASYW